MNRILTIPAPLPVIETVRDAFKFVWVNKFRMLRALFIPAVIIFCLEAVPYISSMISETSDNTQDVFNRYDFALLLVSIPFYVLFAITCHRIALIGDDDVAAYGHLAWSPRETRFLGWSVVIPMVYLLLIIIVPITLGLLYMAIPDFKEFVSDVDESFWQGFLYLLILPCTYIVARFSLIFPAIALDRKVDTTWAWNLSHHNGWRLTVVVGIMPWVFAFIEELLLRDGATLAEELFVILIGLLLLTVEIVALSFSYKHLAKAEP